MAGQIKPNPKPIISANDSDKKKMVQNQLIILIHAAKCQKSTDGEGIQQPCNIPHCRTMKQVLVHLATCKDGRDCSFQHCASSRQIIAHWKNCRGLYCAVCQPLKPPYNQLKVNETGTQDPPTGDGLAQPDWRTQV